MVGARKVVTEVLGKLSPAALRALIGGDSLALRVPGYVPTGLCGEWAARIAESPQRGRFTNVEYVSRIGMALLEAKNDDGVFENYVRNAVERIWSTRALFHPYLSPLDRLRLELDEIWPPGASILRLGGVPAFVGLVRIFDGSGSLPHVDRLGELVPPKLFVSPPVAQLAANVYLEVPETGGELEIWAGNEAFLRRRQDSAYGLDGESLGAPSLRLKPEIGELILFSSARVHRVASGQDGRRTAMSCFIGFFGEDEPLRFWS
jgi:hypothetical protein